MTGNSNYFSFLHFFFFISDIFSPRPVHLGINGFASLPKEVVTIIFLRHCAIILHFRCCKFVIIADIAKMYRMAKITEADHPLQQIL